MTPLNYLTTLLEIPHRPGAMPTRGGIYDPEHNVWISHEFPELAAAASPGLRRRLDGWAELALAAGALHKQQLADAKAGRVWPLRWIEARDGDAVVRFCRAQPAAASPYACVQEDGEVLTYTHAYRRELAVVRRALARLVALEGEQTPSSAPYFAALYEAFAYDAARASDLEAMAAVDLAWLELPSEVAWLPIAEFTENYADPLKNQISHQPAVAAWAQAVGQQHGIGPWKNFFEFRLLAQMDELLSVEEVTAIRATVRHLYRAASDSEPSTHVRTEFRRALINGGHGAYPPKSAKNYPNQDWIRDQYGYRNVVFANQAAEKVREGNAPALRAAFATEWAQRDDFVERLLRANALFMIAHEESHPWVRLQEVSWLEELKADVLGLYALLECPEIEDEIGDLVVVVVGAGLLLHRQQREGEGAGAAQLQDYYIATTLFLTHLLRGGFFVRDQDGFVVDVDRSLAAPRVASFAQRILAIKAGGETAAALYEDLYQGAAVYSHFRGWETEL
jgi:hypothetical protein